MKFSDESESEIKFAIKIICVSIFHTRSVFHIEDISLSDWRISLKKPLPKKWFFLVETVGIEPMTS